MKNSAQVSTKIAEVEIAASRENEQEFIVQANDRQQTLVTSEGSEQGAEAALLNFQLKDGVMVFSSQLGQCGACVSSSKQHGAKRPAHPTRKHHAGAASLLTRMLTVAACSRCTLTISIE